MDSNVWVAYGTAWEKRVAADDTSIDLLRAEFERLEDGSPDEIWELCSDFWERGVRPSRVGREIRRVRRRGLWSAVADTIQLFRSADREPKWMKGPRNFDLLVARPEGWGLPFTDLPIVCDEDEYGWLVRACDETTPDDGEVVYAFDVWLDPGEIRGDVAAVILGKERVGTATLPPNHWDHLDALRAGGVVVSGSLDVDPRTNPFTLNLGVQLPIGP